ncbi:MAG: Crp/Fnr family transcriptional regulator [Chthoniobacterales bacterium]
MTSPDSVFLMLPALSTLSLATKEAARRFAMRTRFKKGEIIFRENEGADRFYIIENGYIDLGYFGPGEDQLIETLGPGEVLGYSWMFEPYRWQSDAKAASDVEAIFCYATPLRALCENDPQMGWELTTWCAAILQKRLRHLKVGFAPVRNCHQEVCSQDPWPWMEGEPVSLQ